VGESLSRDTVVGESSGWRSSIKEIIVGDIVVRELQWLEKQFMTQN
jgi:hypothetical protein